MKLTNKINEDVGNTELKMKKIESRLDKFVANTNDKKVIWYIVGQLILLVVLVILT